MTITSPFTAADGALTWCGRRRDSPHRTVGREQRPRARPAHAADRRRRLGVATPPDGTPAPTIAIADDGMSASLTNGGITVTARMPRWDGRCELTFTDAAGKLLFKEADDGGALRLKARKYEPLPGGGARTTVTFDADPHEHLYGMGEYQQPGHGSQGDIAGAGAPQLAGVSAIRRLLEGLRLPVAQPGGRPAPRSPKPARNGRPPPAIRSTTGSTAGGLPGAGSSGSTPTPPGTRPSCPNGAWASGSASCATGTRSSCSKPPANSSAATSDRPDRHRLLPFGR